ncbi:MAG: hypothetical protein AB1Z98_23680 [Nannocystaceae bacterium]
MSETSLPYEIRNVADPSDGIRLELFVEGERVATATATGDVLDGIRSLLGVSAESVEDDLRASLVALLKGQLEKVALTEPLEDPAQPLRFRSKYTYRDFGEIRTDVVWYDVQASETGPEGVPAVVRNKMRHEVHRLLTGAGSRAREIVDLSG